MDGDRHLSGHTLARHLGEWRGGAGPTRSGTAYLELAERIRLLVLDGRLPMDTRLPAERELAATLAISRTTVAAAYDRLRETGFLRSRRGSGSWTTLPDGPARPEPGAFAPAAPDPSVIDLAYAALPAPAEQLAGVLTEVAASYARLAPGTGYQLLGMDGLRDAVAARFTHRGLPTTREQILVTGGGQQAIALVLATLTTPGDRVLVEHPTYPNALDAITREHARAVPVGFTEHGWDLDTLAAAVRDAAPRLIFTIPDHHNPTGRCMDDDQRRRLATLARRTHTPLVVDETMTELTLEGPAPTPFALAGSDAGAAGTAPVITVGSASKVFWGGMRIGWVRAARSMIERVARTKASVDIATSVLDQLVVERLLGDVDAVLARRLPAVRAAREHLRGLLGQRFPGWTSTRPAGGLSLWVDLGTPVSSALVSAAARHGLLLAAGPRFGLDGAFERFLRLPYTLPEQRLDVAVERLAAAWLSLGGELSLGGGPGWAAGPAEVA